ncbi:MAG: glycosyl hydrolase, partial [Candidatus Eremiobacteraeota bacterium]|nr:glycosyl hydrolase [Candidatus Eremiobacteraeota bacterium]
MRNVAAALALALTVAFASAASAAALEWRNLGPAVAGGRTAAVAGTDDDPYLYYFGSAGGGVFKTSDGGLTWIDVWRDRPVGAIGAVAIAPSNKQVVWVGTGEPNPRNDASYGDGVWVTKDGAKRWTHRGLPNSYAIAKILVDPHDPDVALVGALGNPFVDSPDRGVYRTTDGGATWRKTLYAGPRSGISDMDWDPHDPKVVYAGVWQFRRQPWTFASGGRVDGLYKSTDGGVTWHSLDVTGGEEGRIGIAVAPSNPRRVYALIQSKRGLLWRSDDAGRHWRMMSNDTLIDQRPFYMS